MSQIEENELSEELEKVRVSFGESAEAYRKSPLHGNPADLARMEALLLPAEGERVLDVGTGGGHTAASLAAKGCRVVALDATASMLRETRKLAEEKKVSLAGRVLADGQLLPFAKRSFDIVTCRLVVHHYRNSPAGVREMARILRPGGRLYVFDLSAPDEPELAKFLDGIEQLRDPSHIASEPPSRWRRMVETVGLEITHFRWFQRPTYDLPSWFARSRTPEGNRKEIDRRLAAASPAAKRAFGIETGGDSPGFSSPVVEIVATKR
jgi:ubiquinone/menaquinone biosynthesis C-methylase UbiE